MASMAKDAEFNANNVMDNCGLYSILKKQLPIFQAN